MKRICRTIALILCAAALLSFSGCFFDLDLEYYEDETDGEFDNVTDNETEIISVPEENSNSGNPFWIDKSKLADNYLIEGTSSDGHSFGTRGSCCDITGRTVVITVLYDSLDGVWDFDSDSGVLDQYLYSMYTATEWIKQQAAAYGYNDSYYYFNWKVFPNLVYHGSVNLSFADAMNRNEIQREFAMQFDVDRIMEDYSAKNVAFFFLYKTDTSNKAPSTAHNALIAVDAPYKFEYVDLPIFYCGGYEPPAVYAHEFLHLFGAQDLYCGGDLVTREYAYYQNTANTNDIMRTQSNISTGKYDYDGITNEFSEIDAYYTLLTDYSRDVSEWGLGEVR